MTRLINTPIKSLRHFVLVMILYTLAACGGGNDGTSSGASTVSTTTATAPAAEATVPAEAKLNGSTDEQASAAPVSKMEIGKIYCVKCSSCHVPMDINLSFCPHRTN